MHNTVDYFRCYNIYFAIPIWLFLLILHARVVFLFLYSAILIDEQ